MVSAAPRSNVTIFLGLIGTLVSPAAYLIETSLAEDEVFVFVFCLL